jgi:hypothetical protein
VSCRRCLRGPALFDLDDHPLTEFVVELKFDLFILLSAEKGSAGRMPHLDDAKIGVVPVGRQGDNAHPRILTNLNLYAIADFDGTSTVLCRCLR